MILFLKIDGVLYPKTLAELPSPHTLCCLPRFESVMREYVDVDLVISGPQRAISTLNQLRALFSVDIAQRIIGTTYSLAKVSHEAMLREEGILAWLNKQGRAGESWIALDDEALHFSTRNYQLILCNDEHGFDADIERQLRNAFELDVEIVFDVVVPSPTKKGRRKRRLNLISVFLLRNQCKSWAALEIT